MIRRFMKMSAEAVLGSPRLGGLFKPRTTGMDLILGYHNVVPSGEAAAGSHTLQTSLSSFLEQIQIVGEGHRIVPLSELFTEPAPNESRVVITFDDAYHGAVGHAIPQLARLGLPATVFVAPAFVDGPCFWWDALSDPETGNLSDNVRDHALWNLGGEQERIERWARESGLEWRDMPEHSRCASMESLKTVAALPSIDFSSHSWSHPNLSAMDSERIRSELVETQRWLLEKRLGGSGFLAYPYGNENETVRSIATDCGHTGAVTITGGWMLTTHQKERFAVPRLNVPAGISTRGFALRLRRFLSS